MPGRNGTGSKGRTKSRRLRPVRPRAIKRGIGVCVGASDVKYGTKLDPGVGWEADLDSKRDSKEA